MKSSLDKYNSLLKSFKFWRESESWSGQSGNSPGSIILLYLLAVILRLLLMKYLFVCSEGLLWV